MRYSINDKTKRIIVLGGAGFSAPLGYYTLFNFESAIEKFSPLGTTEKDKRELKNLFQLIRKNLVSKGKNTDFEAILWRFSYYIEMWNNIRLDQFLESKFLSTISDRFHYSSFAQRIGQGQRIVDKVIIDHYGQESKNDDAKKIFEFLKRLLDINGGVLDYFTTNYDIGMESIWSNVENNIPIITGFGNPLKPSGKWDSNLLNIKNENRTGLYVHRLHGCANWSRCVLETDSTQYEITAGIPTKGGEPCIMFPGRKFNTSQPPFADSFKRFREALYEAKCCIIIGTSFRDNNIMEYLLDANEHQDAPPAIFIVNTGNVGPRFFERIDNARKKSHFHYDKIFEQIEFIMGNYIDENTLEKIFSAIVNLESIKETGLELKIDDREACND